MFGIPAFKLSKERILTRRKLYEKSGIDFQLGYEIKSAQEFLVSLIRTMQFFLQLVQKIQFI